MTFMRKKGFKKKEEEIEKKTLQNWLFVVT
jgi:hypothetical protein